MRSYMRYGRSRSNAREAVVRGPIHLGSMTEILSRTTPNACFRLVNCAHGCGKQLSQRQKQQHEDNECNMRPRECYHCHAYLSWSALRAHLRKPHGCTNMTPCPNWLHRNKGRVTLINNRDESVESHRQHCPLQTVSCSQCSKSVRRNELAEHTRQTKNCTTSFSCTRPFLQRIVRCDIMKMYCDNTLTKRSGFGNSISTD